MVHPRIVDSAILTRGALKLGKRTLGLKALCKEFLGLEIRDNREGLHDCVEDVMATREVHLWWLRNKGSLRKSSGHR